MTDLYVINGSEGKGRTYQVREEVLFVGRSADNEVQVPDGFVSRKHLKIMKKGERFFIKDLFSKNGTFVNGELINPGVEYLLSEGLPVVMGMSVICPGKGCSEEILSFLESVQFAIKALTADTPGQDHPSTVQNNMDPAYKICDDLTQALELREILE